MIKSSKSKSNNPLHSCETVELSPTAQRELSEEVLLAHPRPFSWWTGVPPIAGLCPGVDNHGIIRSLPSPNLHNCTRQQVMDYFNNSWTLTEVLFSSLYTKEAFYHPPYHGLRHPLVFYYIHPVVLYLNKLLVAELINKSVNPYFEALFETGVDEMRWDNMSKNTMEWPSLADLHNYRKLVYNLISHIIKTHPSLQDGHPPIEKDNPIWALFMGFEHERIHLETSSVLIRELPIELVRKPAQWPDIFEIQKNTSYTPQINQDYPNNPFMQISAGTASIGKSLDMPTYGWDNEYGERSEQVEEFHASKNLITNAEYWEFVANGGYHEKHFWSEDGWSWRSFRNIKWPTFWYADGAAESHRYKLRTCFDVIPMQWSWPAIVNYHEANAYCNWLSEKDKLKSEKYRLLSESEHHRLRQLVNDEFKYNINLIHGSERPVSMDQPDPNLPGDLFGNVWQWCEDHFNPLPGFKANRLYPDFSAPCFDGQHQIVMGGSFISTGNEASPWARFHFRPHFFQHAGFRIVKSTNDGGAINLTKAAHQENPYETEKILNEYLTLHFAPSSVQMPYPLFSQDITQFPQRCANLVIKWTDQLGIKSGKALDLGCAVGGAAFHLSFKFDEITAIDLSESFINTAKKLQRDGEIEFDCKLEGQLSTKVQATIDRVSAKRIIFKQADACSLPAELVDFDAVLLANLLCRLPKPMACLSRMAGNRGIVKKGGLLVITTPFTWNEQFTPVDLWLGGYTDKTGAEQFSQEGLIEALCPQFKLLDRFDMPMIIREHHRKYQLIITLATVWQRK